MNVYAMVVAASLMVGANAVVGGVAEPGWPIIVTALFEPDSASAIVPGTLSVRIADARGRAVPVPFAAAPPTRGPDGWVQWRWSAGEATGGLEPGRYTVTVEATPADTTLWISHGVLRVVPRGEGRPRARRRLLIEHALLQGRNDDAMVETDRWIGEIGSDEGAWVMRGQLFMAKDLPDSAERSFDRALELHNPTDGEALDIWRFKRLAFIRSLEKRGVVKPTSGDK